MLNPTSNTRIHSPGARVSFEAGLRRGVPASRLLDGVGIDPTEMLAPTLSVTIEQERLLTENLLQSLGEDPVKIGLAVSQQASFGDLGIWGYSMITSSTFGEALDAALKYVSLSPMALLPELESAPNRVSVLLHEEHIPLPVRDFFVARDIFALPKLLATAGVQTNPVKLETRFSGPQGQLVKEALEGMEILTGQPKHRASLPLEFLDFAIPSFDPVVAQVCISECERLLKDANTSRPVIGQVRELLRASPSSMPDPEAVSARLGMSTRTLRRRLADEGTSYRQLREDVCRELAIEMLTSGETPISEIATRLGFDYPSSFGHAFKRWTGKSARQFAQEPSCE